jgi:glycerol-3-phosphate dehydrogenase subunit B
MKFDVIVIGGGMSAIMCGIALATSGKHVALMVKGQSKLNFSSGSIDLLGVDEQGNEVEDPFDAISSLGPRHPYSKMGIANVVHNAAMAPVIFEGAGLSFYGDSSNRNHYRMTPFGLMKPTWLTLDDYITLDSRDSLPWSKVALVNMHGFLDFPAEFVAESLRKLGAECDMCDIKLGTIDKLTSGPTVMRSTAVAKLMQNDGVLNDLARKVRSAMGDAEVVLLPAVFGLDGDDTAAKIAHQVKAPVKFVSTLPPSIAGTRLLSKLRKLFVQNGGTFLLGSMVKSAKMAGDRVLSVEAKNFPDQDIVADHFVLATGSFMNGGLVSSTDGVKEPIFGLDVDYAGLSGEWSKENLFEAQPYMEFGVATDNEFHAIKDGRPLENLYAIGSILSGHNSLKLIDDTGVAVMTALQVARQI